MNGQEIHVGMADWKVAQSPDILSSLGLGSCVGIVLYCAPIKIGGLAHIMLPDIDMVKNKANRGKFANTAIPDMMAKMEEKGADRRLIKAKIAGGAHMFGFARANNVLNVGSRNVEKVKEILRNLHIRLVVENTGGSYGRSLYFYLETGDLRVRTVAHGEVVV